MEMPKSDAPNMQRCGKEECGTHFNVDGHDMFSSHAPCMRQDLLFNASACDVCLSLVEALLHVESINKDSVSHLLLHKRWRGVRKVLSSRQLPSDWADGNLSS